MTLRTTIETIELTLEQYRLLCREVRRVNNTAHSIWSHGHGAFHYEIGKWDHMEISEPDLTDDPGAENTIVVWAYASYYHEDEDHESYVEYSCNIPYEWLFLSDETLREAVKDYKKALQLTDAQEKVRRAREDEARMRRVYEQLKKRFEKEKDNAEERKAEG